MKSLWRVLTYKHAIPNWLNCIHIGVHIFCLVFGAGLRDDYPAWLAFGNFCSAIVLSTLMIKQNVEIVIFGRRIT